MNNLMHSGVPNNNLMNDRTLFNSISLKVDFIFGNANLQIF